MYYKARACSNSNSRWEFRLPLTVKSLLYKQVNDVIRWWYRLLFIYRKHLFELWSKLTTLCRKRAVIVEHNSFQLKNSEFDLCSELTTFCRKSAVILEHNSFQWGTLNLNCVPKWLLCVETRQSFWNTIHFNEGHELWWVVPSAHVLQGTSLFQLEFQVRISVATYCKIIIV